MEENYRILSRLRDEAGRPFRTLRVPVPDPMTATVRYDSLSTTEQKWFEGAHRGEVVEFYLPGGYLNFIIANGVVVTSDSGARECRKRNGTRIGERGKRSSEPSRTAK